jgi:cysteine synthase A
MDESVLDTVGSPLVRIGAPAGATVAAKLESHNPAGSAKDRPAVAMVEAAERAGELAPGDALVEPTSGNTGIGLAMVAAAKGYDLTVVMPEGTSPERRAIMRAYGATVELVDGDISAAKERADRYEDERGMIQLRQFDNPANPDAHYRTTGPEILEQVGDRTSGSPAWRSWPSNPPPIRCSRPGRAVPTSSRAWARGSSARPSTST